MRVNGIWESEDYWDINAETAWDQGAKGEGVNIAVVTVGWTIGMRISETT